MMIGFYQEGQKVNIQYNYNAAGDINFNNVKNSADLVGELEKLKAEILKAKDAEVIDAEIATDVQYQIQKAVDQSQKKEPNKNAILEHLSQAKSFIEGVVDAGGIVTGLMEAIKLAQNLF